MSFEEVYIKNDSGDEVKAIAPIIISASRSTDIPAYYAEWFFNRLQKGYCSWTNPFNRKKMYISFKHCKAVVFWSKNPKPIIPFLNILDKRGIHYYFQFTLNDYVNEGLEPRVPSLEERINTFKELSNLVGSERVIWRFDPLIMLPGFSVDILLGKIKKVGDKLFRHTNKLVFSFVDVKNYQKVQRNIVKELGCFTPLSVLKSEPTESQKEEIATGIARLIDNWNHCGGNIEASSCAEEIDLSKFNIKHNKCIDGSLMEKLFSQDKEFVYYLHTGKKPENLLPGISIPNNIKELKDKGQRKGCGCIESKDIGSYNTCRHYCVYCYANTSRKTVENNTYEIDQSKESLS